MAHLEAARPQFHQVDMEVIAMKGIGPRPQHGVEILAGALADGRHEAALARKAHPSEDAAGPGDGNLAFPAEIESRDIEGIGLGMFGQLAAGRIVAPPAGIG
jgi:hypothetical protein